MLWGAPALWDAFRRKIGDYGQRVKKKSGLGKDKQDSSLMDFSEAETDRGARQISKREIEQPAFPHRPLATESFYLREFRISILKDFVLQTLL